MKSYKRHIGCQIHFGEGTALGALGTVSIISVSLTKAKNQIYLLLDSSKKTTLRYSN